MQDLLKSIEGALRAGYIYPVFMSVLCLPDICGYIDNPGGSNVGKRYEDWFTSYMPQTYSGYMSGKEAYGLRCVVLHNGELSLAQFTNRASNSSVILDKFQLFKDGIHLIRLTGNEMNGVALPNLVVLSAVKYCQDIIDGVRKWEEATGKKLGEYDEVFAIREGGNEFAI